MTKDLVSKIGGWMSSHKKTTLFGAGALAGFYMNDMSEDLTKIGFFAEGLLLSVPAYIACYSDQDLARGPKVGALLYTGTLLGQAMVEGVKTIF